LRNSQTGNRDLSDLAWAFAPDARLDPDAQPDALPTFSRTQP